MCLYKVHSFIRLNCKLESVNQFYSQSKVYLVPFETDVFLHLIPYYKIPNYKSGLHTCENLPGSCDLDKIMYSERRSTLVKTEKRIVKTPGVGTQPVLFESYFKT